MTDRDRLANSALFKSAGKAEQAEMLVWLLDREGGHGHLGSTPMELSNLFDVLSLPLPNQTRLRDQLRKSKNARTRPGGRFGPTRDFVLGMDQNFPRVTSTGDEIFDADSIALPPYVHGDRRADLARMIKAYAYLFLLENSMRGLIEKVLTAHLGADWWDKAANSGMKKKQADRVANENTKKWAPTRSDFGPLYALDWPDLITLMRKFPDHFVPHLGEIDFLHRFSDAGAFRNVVAHNGVLRDDDSYDLIRIYYRDWLKQLS